MVADVPEGPVEVGFSVRRGPDFVREDALPVVTQWPGAAGPASGYVSVRAPGAPNIDIYDELGALVLNLCFAAVADACRSGHGVASYFSEYGYVRLDVESHLARVSGDGVADVRFPGAPLLGGLLGCGARYLRWRSDLSGIALEQFDTAHSEANEAFEQWRARLG